MTSKRRYRWYWEQPDPRSSGSSGDLAKLFRNEVVSTPGVLARNAPSAMASTVAREVIQNAWDAAKDLRSLLDPADAPDFDLEFRYRSLTGIEKRTVVRQLDLDGLAVRSGKVDRRALGLGDSDCLQSIKDIEAPLRVLEVRESGASGMYGRFDNAKSKLFLALAGIGYTSKQKGAGGSFGFGKAGMIRASAIHTVVAYTCFPEQKEDPGVTRRMLGMAYWGQHEIDGDPFTGFARLGDFKDGWQQPLENEAADSFAASIGVQIRSSLRLDELGTTLVLPDPTLDAEDLCRAVERNWWPALLDHAFTVTIIDETGRQFIPRPRKDRTIAPFLRAYELAVTPQDNVVATEFSRSCGTTRGVAGKELSVGSVGLVADVDGWSYGAASAESDDDSPPERSLVALVRGPRMVVEYLDVGGHVPFVRGAFVADDEIDDLLRQSEPKAHDSWQTAIGEEGIDPNAPRVASSVHQKIRVAVREFRRRLRPPELSEDEVYLPTLQELIRRGGVGGTAATATAPSAPPQSDVAVSIERTLIAGEEAGDVVMRASIHVAPAPAERPISEPMQVEFALKFVEDGRGGRECPFAVFPPAEFAPHGSRPHCFVGVPLDGGSRFEIVSDPYISEWTARLIVQAGSASDIEERP